MSKIRRTLLGLHPHEVDQELAEQQATHAALLDAARRQVSSLASERQSLTESLRRLMGRRSHLEAAVARMTLTAERDQRIAARAEERLQNEIASLENAHRQRMGELRREEASLRALLHRDTERFRTLVARLRSALPATTPTEEVTPLSLAQVAIAHDSPVEE